MKTNIKIKKVLSTISISLLIGFSLNTNAQCERKKFCNENMGDFDYRSQSVFAKLSPGDSSSVSVVLYSNQSYRIFVCCDPELGQIDWKVVSQIRKTKRKIVSIKKDTLVINETNEYGDYKTDQNGNLIVKERKLVVDTVWAAERITTDKVLYDINDGDGKPYFEYVPKKTERLTIRIAVQAGDPTVSSCANVYIGRMPMESKSFHKSGQNVTNDTY